MNSFFKNLLIFLLVIVSVPVVALFAYCAWLERQDSEVVVMSLKCHSNENKRPLYYRITKKRKSDTPDYLSVPNAQHEGDSIKTDDLFITNFELKELTAEYADYHLSDSFLRSENLGRSQVTETIIRIHRETLSYTWLEDGEEVKKYNLECEEISNREIMKVARENFAAATKDRKF